MAYVAEQSSASAAVTDADWFLQSLVNMANNDELEMGLTLQVGGFLVSGILVGGRKYFEGFAKDFASGFDEESAPEVEASVSGYGDLYTSDREKADRPGSWRALQYVHLKDARFFHPSGKPIPVQGGVWWRGRLNQVAGFIPGEVLIS
jgi:hypothetical protein